MSARDPQSGWELYEFLPAFVLGFHGCDQSIGEAILRGDQKHLKKSQNDYDWLGKGLYFWESNPRRALEFAGERASGGKNSKGAIKKRFVLGAIINMGRCLNLSDSSALDEVQRSHEALVVSLQGKRESVPENLGKLKRLARGRPALLLEPARDRFGCIRGPFRLRLGADRHFGSRPH